MSRKSLKVQKEYEKLAKEAQEALEKLEEENKKEKEFLATLTEEINQRMEKEDLFCGVVIGKEDAINIIKLLMEGKDSVKIPFNLYYNN